MTHNIIRYDVYRCLAIYYGTQPYVRGYDHALPRRIVRSSPRWTLLP